MKKTSMAIFRLLVILTTIVFSQSCFQGATQPAFDIIIANGRLYDGTTDKPVIADIGIKGDKIAAIGKFSGMTTVTIDATGLIVAPGLIDVHSHTDLLLKEKGLRRVAVYIKPSLNGNHNYLRQGVTTVVTGNCSLGYTKTAKWLGWVDSLKFGTNVHHLVPAGAVGEELFGKNFNFPLNEKQKEIFTGKLIKEIENGAIGVSFDLSKKPGNGLTTEDLVEIGRAIKPYDGMLVFNLRDSSGLSDANGNPAFIQSLREVVEIGKKSSVAVHLANLELNAPANNVSYARFAGILRDARREGADITADQGVYGRAAARLTEFLPDTYLSKGRIKKEYTTPEGKTALLKIIEQTFRKPEAEALMVERYRSNKSYEGKTLRQIAALEGKTLSQCCLEILTADEPPLVLAAKADETFARKLMKESFVFTSSEGMVWGKDGSQLHPGNWGAFPRKLRKYALEDKIINLQHAIRSMTALPAEKYRIAGRGRIAVGNFADIAIFDLKKIMDKATFSEPEQYAAGVEYLIVNGILSIEQGEITGKKGGRPLKRF